MKRIPERIICLTEETTEALYRMGAGDLVVGVSSYTERPPEAAEKPTVCSFIKANTRRIVELEPDLVLAFSDLQGDIVAELMKLGLTVVGFNQRSIEEILASILLLGRLVDRVDEATALVAELEQNVQDARAAAAGLPARPRVFFEEWHDPLISGIRWPSEIVEICGGIDTFPELRHCAMAKERIVDSAEVARRAPDLVLASWCGKPVQPELIRGREGWEDVPAIRRDQIVEVDSTLILQPGPAALSDGLLAVRAAVEQAAAAMA